MRSTMKRAGHVGGRGRSPKIIATMKRTPSTLQLAVLSALTVLSWSVLFRATFSYSFYWDDLHLIRPYSWAEILSAFHGPTDPDRIETMALRPVGTLLFCLQGSAFGENVVLQRLFMALLMTGFVLTIGLLLREVGLSLRHVAVVFALFVSSKAFSALLLWLTLGALILSYILMTLTAICYLRWLKGRRRSYLAATLGFAVLAVFTREEAYTLPIVLTLLWYVTVPDKSDWKRAVAGAFGVTMIVVTQYLLRGVFVPQAPSIQPSLDILLTLRSSWMPGGINLQGTGDQLLAVLWQVFLGALVVLLVRVGSARALHGVIGACTLGLVLCIPSLAVARPFGTAMPTIAFFTAISIAVFDVHERISQRVCAPQGWGPAVAFSVLLLGGALGIGGGIQRSLYLAEGLRDDSAIKAMRDGDFLFGVYPNATIPSVRRESGLARLAAFGIRSREDLDALKGGQIPEKRQPAQGPGQSAVLFPPKYDPTGW
jgi:hypothetical protein